MSAGPLSDRQYAMRWLLGIVAGVVSIPVAVWLTYGPGGQDPLLGLREDLRPSTFGLLAWLVCAVLIGAAVQTPLALLRGAGVAKGWLVVLGLLGFAGVVLVAALVVEPLVPEPVPWSRRRSRDNASWYPVAVWSIEAGYAVFALSGAMFWGGRQPAASKQAARERERALPSLVAALAAAFAIPGAVGWAILAAIAAYGAARQEAPWAPENGLPFLLPGALLGTVFIVVGLCAAIREREVQRVTTATADPGGYLTAAGCGVGLLLIGLAGAQLGHVAHVGIVITAAVPVFLTTPFLLMRALNAIPARRGPRSRGRRATAGD